MNTLPVPKTGEIHLLLVPRRTRDQLVAGYLSPSDLIAQLALSGPLQVLDGGNCFDAYTIARSIRRETHQLNSVLAQLHIARAFTCYQVVALLARKQAAPVPLLVLDLLATFYDENVPLKERFRLLEQAISDLKRLAALAPLVISARLTMLDCSSPHFSSPQPIQSADDDPLLSRLAQEAGYIWHFEMPQTPTQLRLL
jgi:hypothetical protein